MLVGGDGPRSLAAVAEYGDAWIPIVDDPDEFEAKLTQLQRLCQDTSRPTPQITVMVFEPDKDLLARCAQLGVTRYIALAPSNDLATLHSFLDRYSRTADGLEP